MILIVGSDNDDIAYIVKTMSVDHVDIVAGRYEVHVGRYAERDVVVSATGYGQEMAALVTGLLVEKYNPYIIISVGCVQSVSEGLKREELFLATRVYAMDCNLMGLGQYKYGQVPEMPDFFISDSELRSKILSYNTISKNHHIVEGVLLSSNTYYNDLNSFQDLQVNHFAKVSPIHATDTETAGVFCAATLFNLPVLVIKGCTYELQDKAQRVARTRTGILLTPVIGKLIHALLNTLA